MQQNTDFFIIILVLLSLIPNPRLHMKHSKFVQITSTVHNLPKLGVKLETLTTTEPEKAHFGIICYTFFPIH